MSQKLILFVIVFSLFTTKQVSGRRTTSKRPNIYSIVIGNNTYLDPAAKLNYAERDAREFHQAMIIKGRISRKNTTLLLGRKATKQKTIEAFKKLKRRVSKDSTVIIYFSGHGNVAGGNSYLILHDTRYTADGISHHHMRQLLKHLKCKVVVFLIDACKNGYAIKNGRQKKVLFNPEPFSGKGIVVIASSRHRQNSHESTFKQHGIFTYFLLKAINGEADLNRDKIVTLTEAWSYIRLWVTRYVKNELLKKQDPVFHGTFSGRIPLSFLNPRMVFPIQTKPPREKEWINFSLSVFSTPSPALVYANAILIGKTPLIGKKIKAEIGVNRINFKIARQGYVNDCRILEKPKEGWKYLIRIKLTKSIWARLECDFLEQFAHHYNR